MTSTEDRTDPSFGETVGAFLAGAVVWGLIEKGGGAAVLVATVLNAWLHQSWTRTLLTACLWLVIPYAVGWGLFAVSEGYRNRAASRPPSDLPRTSPPSVRVPRQEPPVSPVQAVSPSSPPQPAPPPGDDAMRDGDWLDELLATSPEELDDEREMTGARADDMYGQVQTYRLSAIRDVIGAHRPWRPGEAVVVVTDADGKPFTGGPDGVVAMRWLTVCAYASPEELESGAAPVERTTVETLLDLQEIAARMRRPTSPMWGLDEIP